MYWVGLDNWERIRAKQKIKHVKVKTIFREIYAVFWVLYCCVTDYLPSPTQTVPPNNTSFWLSGIWEWLSWGVWLGNSAVSWRFGWGWTVLLAATRRKENKSHYVPNSAFRMNLTRSQYNSIEKTRVANMPLVIGVKTQKRCMCLFS